VGEAELGIVIGLDYVQLARPAGQQEALRWSKRRHLGGMLLPAPTFVEEAGTSLKGK
jgi:hypothetical protein